MRLMTKRSDMTAFIRRGDSDSERAASVLRESGSLLFRRYDVDAEKRNADAAVYFSGKSSVPQVFVGSYPIGGAEDLEQLWRTRKLRDIAHAVASEGLDIDAPSDDELAAGAEDIPFTAHIPPSDGTHSADPEQWPILHFYKDFFGFWPHTFVYLHHWPEAYKRFVYCHNMATIGTAKEVLGSDILCAVGYATSNAHGCNYCQVHAVSTMGDSSMRAVEQLRMARIGQRNADNPFDEYLLSLADLASMSSLNQVPDHYLQRLRRLAEDSEHAPVGVNAQVMSVALVSAAFGFLNVFNDLVGMEIEGAWAVSAQERLDIDAGRHGASSDNNPDNLSHPLPSGGPTAQEMIDTYASNIGDATAYMKRHFGIVPPWLPTFPEQLQPLHTALYAETMRQQHASRISAELKHLIAYVSHVEKQHPDLAATEASIAHHVAGDKERTIRRLKHAFAIASGRGGNPDLFTEAEHAALRLAYLSAQLPLITPRRFVQPVMDNFDAGECIELFTVCGIASLVQRFAAIIRPVPNPILVEFMAAHRLPMDAASMRFPLPHDLA